MSNPTTSPVTITFAPAPAVENNKATRKLATEAAVREVGRAITAWYYTRG